MPTSLGLLYRQRRADLPPVRPGLAGRDRRLTHGGLGGLLDRLDLGPPVLRHGYPARHARRGYARTLLINIPDPAQVVTEMVRLAIPGGWVLVLEPDAALTLCYPAHPAWDRLVELFLATNRAQGADAFIGRRLPELFRQAGLTGIGTEARADIYPLGHSRRTVRLDLVRSMRPAILELGLASDHELDELDWAAREHLADPDTLVMSHLLFLAWGRKPAS